MECTNKLQARVNIAEDKNKLLQEVQVLTVQASLDTEKIAKLTHENKELQE